MNDAQSVSKIPTPPKPSGYIIIKLKFPEIQQPGKKLMALFKKTVCIYYSSQRA